MACYNPVKSRIHNYSRRPLFQTPKGPEILFELANVRINQG